MSWFLNVNRSVLFKLHIIQTKRQKSISSFISLLTFNIIQHHPLPMRNVYSANTYIISHNNFHFILSSCYTLFSFFLLNTICNLLLFRFYYYYHYFSDPIMRHVHQTTSVYMIFFLLWILWRHRLLSTINE